MSYFFKTAPEEKLRGYQALVVELNINAESNKSCHEDVYVVLMIEIYHFIPKLFLKAFEHQCEEQINYLISWTILRSNQIFGSTKY